jgi:hypothetical protein
VRHLRQATITAERWFVRCEQVIVQAVESKQVLLNLADGQCYALDT